MSDREPDPAQLLGGMARLFQAEDFAGDDKELSADDQPAPAGRRIGPYEVQDPLSQWALGEVYRATNPANENQVALHVVEGPIDNASVEKFRRHTEGIAALHHPGILSVIGVGGDEDRVWIAYELVEERRTLADYWHKGTVALRLALVSSVAQAVAHAHERGLVHLGLDPDVVLVDASGAICVADFGLEWVQKNLAQRVEAGRMPTNMAPEQLAGRQDQIGLPADVWSLGVLLYRALSGSRPFKGQGLAELRQRVAVGRLPPLGSDVLPALAAVCERALAKAPQDRQPDAGAFARQLEAALSREPPRTRFWPLAVALFGAGSLLLAAALLLAKWFTQNP